METVKFACNIEVNVPSMPLDFKILINDQTVFNEATDQPTYQVSTDIKVEDGKEYTVKFVLAGKTDQHSIINDNKEIVESAQITITDVSLEDIAIADIFLSNDDLAMYTHDTNGYSDEVTVTFDFCMGCNGSAEFTFSTPVYIWMLENMQL